MLRKTRIILAVLFLAGITLLFLGVGLDWWGWMAKIQFIPSVSQLFGEFALFNLAEVVLLLLLTLVLGRIYCSVICPLGVFQDVVSFLRRQFGLTVDRINRKKAKNYAARLKLDSSNPEKPAMLKPIVKHYSYSRNREWLRTLVLCIFAIPTFITGQMFISFVAPYSSYGKMVQAAMGIAEGSIGTALLIWGCAIFVIISLSAWFWGRVWCNNICPVGTVLGWVSRFSLFKIHIDESKCVACGRCGRGCKSSCIDMKNHKVDYSRCVDCFDCIGRCEEGAISFGLDKKKKTASEKMQEGKAEGKTAPEKGAEAGSGKGRRAFLATSALLVTSLTGQSQEKRKDGGLAPVTPKSDPGRPSPIFPPGALSVKNFQNHCTSCQLCVSSCPNGVLRPGTSLEHFLQPQMGYENGWCRPECTACSEACPSGAIIRISREQKTALKIGTARVNPELCLAVNGEDKCGSCAAHCPTGAVTMVTENGKRRPVVAEQQCIGCGACEYLCPVRPVSAIVIEGLEVHTQK